MNTSAVLRRSLLFATTFLIVSHASAQLPSEQIRLNQVGFYPDGPKVAGVIEAPAGSFEVIDAETGTTVLTGDLGAARLWSPSGEMVRLADFTELDAEGYFFLNVPGIGVSYPFRVGNDVHQEVARGTLKALYFQRASTALEPEYAGAWARAAGHPDDQVEVHPSAATDSRPAGTIISASRGWYDAGDYNKYIVPAAFTSYVMLAGLEHYPEYYSALETDIPESGNGVPDVLDEAVWNLRFMLDMQDPDDGGVYHKLTTANFQGTVAPHVPTATRYVVQKSITATLDFAAASAQASRVLRAYEDVYPGLADSALAAAQFAWNWARSNPNVAYNQNQINQDFNPDINTGEYGDGNRADELAWAAIELYMTTGQDSFHQDVNIFASNSFPGWGSVNMLGYLTLARLEAPTAAGEALQDEAIARLISGANQSRNAYQTSPMGTAFGNSSGSYYWGSNGGAGAVGMVLVNAYALTGDESYRDAAISAIDYLLGLNGTGYSYLTGYGARPTVDPHHRPSASDNIPMPVPGLLAGGPNPGQQDNCTYPSDLPAKSYVDDYCSYASNEITTYWNVPLLYAAAGVEAHRGNEPAGNAPPQLLSPMPRQANMGIFVPFAWTATAPFEAFDVQVSAAPDFTSPVLNERTTSNSSLTMLPPDGAYYWRVRGVHEGDSGPWSSVGVFHVGQSAALGLAFQESGGMIVFEAESRSGQLTQSGGEFVFWRPITGDVGQTAYGSPNTGRSFGDAFRGESPMLYYSVAIRTPGTWYAWARMFSTSDEDDEIHLGIDAVPFTDGDPLQAGAPHGEWHWVNTTASGARASVEIDEPGRYLFTMWMAEDGVLVDRFVLTTDPNFEPDGEGPSESERALDTGTDVERPDHRMAIESIYPMPARDRAIVAFSIPTTEAVRLELFDVTGRQVALLLDSVLPSGLHKHNIISSNFASGSYFLRLTAGGRTEVKTMVVVK